MVTHTVNQLLAVEYALAEHVCASVNTLEEHEATSGVVCTGCSFTAADFNRDPSAHLGFSEAVRTFARNANARNR